MPEINKPKRRTLHMTDDTARKDRQQVYQSRRWRDLRQGALQAQPLCAVCEIEGRSTLAVDVHHLHTFTRQTGAARLGVAYDPANLVSLCKSCHNRIHHGDLRGAETIEEIRERLSR